MTEKDYQIIAEAIKAGLPLYDSNALYDELEQVETITTRLCLSFEKDPNFNRLEFEKYIFADYFRDMEKEENCVLSEETIECLVSMYNF